VFFFLPGSHHHGDVVVTDERYDLRLYLAQRGVETWTLDYRTHFITREQIFDSSFMQDWTAQVFIEDAVAAANFVRQTSGVQKIFVGGYSRGATFAALMAARYSRQDVLGLALLDGYAREPPGSRAMYRERAKTPTWFADDLERRYVPYRRWIKIRWPSPTVPILCRSTCLRIGPRC
jgi:pimeloyl-ACP methyl ester carboxylesterase